MQTKESGAFWNLANLKSASELETVSISTLARQGTSVLQRILESAEGVTIKVQGQGAMVTLSQRQYDEMVEVIRKSDTEAVGDGFEESLRGRFDSLVARMNQPGASEAVNAALFAEPESLNRTWKPGETETKS